MARKKGKSAASSRSASLPSLLPSHPPPLPPSSPSPPPPPPPLHQLIRLAGASSHPMGVCCWCGWCGVRCGGDVEQSCVVLRVTGLDGLSGVECPECVLHYQAVGGSRFAHTVSGEASTRVCPWLHDIGACHGYCPIINPHDLVQCTYLTAKAHSQFDSLQAPLPPTTRSLSNLQCVGQGRPALDAVASVSCAPFLVVQLHVRSPCGGGDEDVRLSRNGH